MNRSTAITATDAISTYILAKDSNRPQLMKRAFAGDCELEMVVNTDAISFPSSARGLEQITQVLVTDGGTVVIGGVIQSNNSVNIAQVPVLGSIPWLGNLFKHQTVNSSNQELIFFITPRVIET